MIPFNKLGWAFHRFGKHIYPQEICQSLCNFLETLPSHANIIDIGAGTTKLATFKFQATTYQYGYRYTLHATMLP